MDNRYIKISLDDAIIDATNEDGSEKLRLSMKVDGHDVLVRFPSYGDWDFFASDLARLFLIMSKTASDIEMDIDFIPEKHFPQWAFIVSQVLKIKECRKLVDKIFFEYLRPEVPGLEVEDQKKWLAKNMNQIHLFYMFQSILHIEDWIKKKALELVERTFQNLAQPSSRDTSAKNSTPQQNPLEPGQPYVFG